MLRSQFLFIYIVYILAFISAVLMLFLSVVLMLPISTLTTKNTLTDKKNQHKSYFIISVITQENLTSVSFSSAVCTLLLLFIFFIKLDNILGTAKPCRDFLHYTKLHFKTLNLISKGKYHKQDIDLLVINVPSLSTLPRFIELLSYHLLRISNHALKTTVDVQSKNTNGPSARYILMYCLLIIYACVKLVAAKLTNFLLTAQAPQYKIRTAFQVFKNISHLPQGTVKVVYEVVLQTYLLITSVLCMVLLFLSKQNLLLSNESALNNNFLQGLGQIKSLLYGDFSLFLLLSTFVLLIALLGAAVMTRSKR